MVILQMGSAIALAMPIWSSWASTKGKARTSPIRCRSLTPSYCVVVARYLWCLQPLDQFRSQKIAIAWDGSREAVRAVHDALPLLALSQSAQIVTIIPPEAVESSDDAKHLSAHLANHGIKIEASVIQTRAEEEPISLRQQTEKADYDLLVMGGYSHPKWLEFIFGGATQSILLSSKIPVLVSH